MKLDKSILEEFKDYYNLNDSQLSMVEKGFYSFLELHVGNHSHFAMLSEDVDTLWHFLILHTPHYLKVFTKINIGRVLEHSPHIDSESDDVKKQVVLTLDKYDELSLPVPKDVLGIRPIDLENSTKKNVVLKPKRKASYEIPDVDIDENGFLIPSINSIADFVQEIPIASTKTSQPCVNHSHSSHSSNLSSCSSSSSSHSHSHSSHSSCSSSSCSSSSSSSCSSSSCSS